MNWTRSSTVTFRGTAARRGITLLELIVVIAIVLALVGMVAVFMPGFELRERANAGASRLQQYLAIARQRAVLDRAPRGVRLYPSADYANYLTSAKYIEQPEDFYGGTAETDPADPTNTRVVLKAVDVTGGFTDPTLWPVQRGDYLRMGGSGLVHQILDVSPGAGGAVLSLASPLPQPVRVPTADYRIVRRPRTIGEELDFPHNVAVDLNTNIAFGNPVPLNADGSLDILFAPSGAVLGNFTTDKVILWVREIGEVVGGEPPDPFYSDPSLIVVFTRSGLVESYDVDKKNKTDPYSVIK